MRNSVASKSMRTELPATQFPQNERRERPSNRAMSSEKLEFIIEPSPIPGERVVYPTIAKNGIEVNLSILIPARNAATRIIKILDSFTTMLNSRSDFSYEIIVVDLNSSDTTRKDSIQYATTHNQVRVLHVPFNCHMGPGVLIGMLRTRGSNIFIYNIDDGIPATCLSEFERKLQTGMAQSRHVFVVGNWLRSRADVPGTRSSLNIFLEWLVKWLLSWLVKEEQADHARTILLTREAARTIGRSIIISSETYSIEMVTAAALGKMEMKTVKLDVNDPRRWERPVESGQRLDDALMLMSCLFLHWTGKFQVKTAQM